MSEKRKFLACKLLYILGALLVIGAIALGCTYLSGPIIGLLIGNLIAASPFIVIQFFNLFSTNHSPKDLYEKIICYGTPFIEGLEKVIENTDKLKDLIKPYEEFSVHIKTSLSSKIYNTWVYIIKDKYGQIHMSKYPLSKYDNFKDYYISLCPTPKELSDFIKIHKDSIAKREFNKSIEEERFRKIREVLNK